MHIALRGIRDDKSALDLPRDYVRHGIRAIAEDLCTRQLGHRNHLDAAASERPEIQERRFTPGELGRRSGLWLSGALPHPAHGNRPGRGDGRYAAISRPVLKAMQRTSDRQKMLASHGALLSDERLQLVVLDFGNLKTVAGRVLARGEEEVGKGAGRHYLRLEGTDAQMHLIYYTPEMEEARSRGKLRANSFVRLQKKFENGRPGLEVEDFGDAERVLRNDRYLKERAQLFLTRGTVPPDDGWGGWLDDIRLP